MPGELSDSDVRRVARLAHLSLTDAELSVARERLSRVVEYVDRLRSIDLTGVEPMAHSGDVVNRLLPDEPGRTLSPESVLELAPDRFDQFIRVPKVLGDGGGA